MKKRMGFVSNSSSASFVVHWRMRSLGEKVTIKKALSHLFDISSYDEGTDKVNWNDNWTKQYKDVIEYATNMSKLNYDGSFTTLFSTVMMNTYDDFGNEAKSLILALVADDDFQIIDTKLRLDQ